MVDVLIRMVPTGVSALLDMHLTIMERNVSVSDFRSAFHYHTACINLFLFVLLIQQC